MKKLTLICDTYKADDIEYLMLGTASNIPEDLLYEPSVQWMQVVRSALSPKVKYYISKTGKHKTKEYPDYIAIRVKNTPTDKEKLQRWRECPNFIDEAWVGPEDQSSTWYFFIPAIESK